MERVLIINADDFGQTESCTLAIAKAFTDGLISSTTAVANGEYLELAYSLATEIGFTEKVGIHINFTEGKPLTNAIASDGFFCKDGVFHDRIDRYAKLSNAQVKAVKAEVNAQIERLKSVGFIISHADSHHHIHTGIYLFKAIKEALKENGINKIRIHRNVGKIPFYKRMGKRLFNRMLIKSGFITVKYFGGLEDFTLRQRVLDKGSCEIMVHPDFDCNGTLIDRIKREDGKNIGEDLCKTLNGLQTKAISYKEL